MFFHTFVKQFSGRGILKAKSPEPGGGCNVERSRVSASLHARLPRWNQGVDTFTTLRVGNP